jgi:hypothetical protein
MKLRKIKGDKRAVSLMVSYAILIVIAIALSILVYPRLKLLLPSERVECSDGIALGIEEVVCDLTENKLTLTLSNRGLFNVTAAFVRLDLSGNEVKKQINTGEEYFPLSFTAGTPPTTYIYDLSTLNPVAGEHIVEVQPAIQSERTLVPCKTIATQPVTCS